VEVSDKLAREIEALAKLRLEPGERESMRGDLSRVLEHFRSIAELDLDGIEPDGSDTLGRPLLRDDEPRPGLSQEAALSGAAETEAGHFRVPPVIGEDEHA